MADSKKDAPKESDFEYGKKLGEGAFGQVCLGTHKNSGRKYAVKMIDKRFISEKKNKEIVFRERQVLNTLAHPFIIKLSATFQTSSHLFFILEFCPGGEMFEHLRATKSFNMEVTQFYTAEIVLAMEYMHSKGIMHRDMKPENMLLDEQRHIRIIDFGTAKQIGTVKGTRTKSFEGTAEYISPELLGWNDNTTGAGLVADLWALGCIVYQFLVGRPPFRSNTGIQYQTFQLILNKKVIWPDGFPPVAKDFVDGLLTLDPDKRLGANGYDEIKQHPFFQGVNWSAMSKREVTPPALAPMDPPLKYPEMARPKLTIAPTPGVASIANPLENEAGGSGGGGGGGSEMVDAEPEFETLPNVPERWAKLIFPGENIIEMGLVWKKRRAFNIKKRQLILTTTPRLIYVDPEKMVVKGEIPWSNTLHVELKSDRVFHIHTPKRVYMLDDRSRGASRWQRIIDDTIIKTKDKPAKKPL